MPSISKSVRVLSRTPLVQSEESLDVPMTTFKDSSYPVTSDNLDYKPWQLYGRSSLESGRAVPRAHVRVSTR